MPRGDSKIVGTPYRIWTLEVDKQQRVRVPLSEARAIIQWINSEPGPIECVATPGPAGGLQIEPAASQETLRQAYNEALGDSPAKSSESGEEWMDVARLLATTWRIPISIESGRISITLPEPVRRTLLVPGAGGIAVVFGFGGVLEVWHAAKWHDHVQAIAKTKLSAVSEAIEGLQDR
jgi:hypothetical protein